MKMIFLNIFVVIFLSCTDNKIKKVYKNREYLMDLCKDKVLQKSRGNSFVLFKTIKNKSINEYYFDVDSGVYKFVRDTIQYTPDIIELKSARGTNAYKIEVCNYVKTIDEKLESLSINEFSTQFDSFGEPFKFYMKDGKIVIFIPNIEAISKDEEYIESLNKIGEYWYYINSY